MMKILKNIFIFISYFIYEYLFLALLEKYGINYKNLNYSNKVLIVFIINLIFMIFLLIMYRKEIKKDILDFKTNYKTYLSKNVGLYILGVFLMAISNILLQHFTHLEISGNEESVRSLIDKIPLFMAFSSIIYAPFTEEIIFRKTIKNIIKHKYIFIILSGVIFGVLHISDFKDINQILMGIPYIIMGIDFAYIYYRTNNIFTTMTFHLCHNLLLFTLQLI